MKYTNWKRGQLVHTKDCGEKLEGVIVEADIEHISIKWDDEPDPVDYREHEYCDIKRTAKK